MVQIADLTYDLNNDATFYVNITPKPGYEIFLVYGDDDYSNGIWTADFSDDLDWFSHQSKSISLFVTKIRDEDKEHTVTFDWGEGSAVVQAANGAALGEALPAGPVRYSQKVEGWNTRPDGRGMDITADTPITQDLTVYPQWGSASLLSEYHIMDLDRIQAVAADKLGVDAGAVTVKRVQATDGKNTTTGLPGSSYYNKSAGCWTALNAAGVVKPEDLTGLVVTVQADGREQQVTIPAGEFASMVRYKHFAEIVL